jgi:hypothetical protein
MMKPISRSRSSPTSPFTRSLRSGSSGPSVMETSNTYTGRNPTSTASFCFVMSLSASLSFLRLVPIIGARVPPFLNGLAVFAHKHALALAHASGGGKCKRRGPHPWNAAMAEWRGRSAAEVCTIKMSSKAQSTSC